MGTEKVLAFYQSWAAMAMEMFRMQMSLAQAFTATSMSPLMQGPRPMDVSKAAAAGVRVLAAGLTPVHGKAVANARRLARRRR